MRSMEQPGQCNGGQVTLGIEFVGQALRLAKARTTQLVRCLGIEE
jgi:hypothetical protein